MGTEFQALIKDEYSIKAVPISSKNPQANAILERVHQVLGNLIRTFELEELELDEDNPFTGILSAVSWAIRSMYHTTLQATPGQLVFGRDMILNLHHIANWKSIQARKQDIINKNLWKENDKRINYDYAVGDKILLARQDASKVERPYDGPYKVVRVHTNGTIMIQKGAVTMRINIRHTIPYHD